MQSPAPRAVPDTKVAIIGAGFAGLCMAIKLREAGYEDFLIFEKADEVGGTWRENHYPGCACDVPSHLYSYSFEPNPGWSRAFSPQEEIFDYLKHCAEKYELSPFIRFGVKMTNATFDETSGFWRVTTSDGKQTTAQHLVSGAGGLHIPARPDLPGIDDFSGTMFHSAEWDHEFDFTDKTVAIIGTGASAIQFVPEIAKQAADITVFQRTAPWIMPKMDEPIPEKRKARFRKAPWRRELLRKLIYARLELTTWLFANHPERVRQAEKIGKDHIAGAIKDPELQAKVTPPFALGCKRVLLSNDWYPTLALDHVHLDTGGIDRITPHGLVTRDGREIKVDAIILGTGFKAMEMPEGMEIIGRAGRSMRDEWAATPEAYLGITCSGFPNYYMLMGPNTGLGTNSMVFMIEAQVHYAIEAIRLQEMKALAFMDVRTEAQRTFNDRLQEKLKGSVWATGCNSWYQTASGHNAAIWPSTTVKYWLKTRHVDESDYDAVKIQELGPAGLAAPA